MNRQQTDLLRSSFALMQPMATEISVYFNALLKQADPQLGKLFERSSAHQGKGMIPLLGGMLSLAEMPATLAPVLRMIGARHAGYGVTEAHYDCVAKVLAATLQEVLGDAFTPATRSAWAELYEMVSATMQESVAQRVPASMY
jgi:hemoglobin-like flavoprotein